MKNIVLVSLIVGLYSCSPQSRLNRLISRHPELLTRDSVIFRDTLITRHERFDTLWTIQDRPLIPETLFLEKDRFQIQLLHHYDSIRILTTIPADTVIINKTIPIDRIVVKKDSLWMCFKRLSPYLLGFLFFLVLLRFLLQKW